MLRCSRLVASCIAGLTLATVSVPAEAGLIPWAYNAVFGPVGSTFGYGAQRPVFGGRYAYYGNYGYPAASSCCGTGTYSAGYAPYYSGYNSCYGCSTCNSCNSGCSTCNSCNYGYSSCGCGVYGCAGNCSNCPTGNCNSGLTPAAGTTDAGTTTNNATPTPTKTFKSTEPTVNPDAGNSTDSSKPNYDEKNNGGFEMPDRNETETEKDTGGDAPPFQFNSGISAPLNVPSAPMVPLEIDRPENSSSVPSSEGFGSPELKLVPAPIAARTLDKELYHLVSSPVRMNRSAVFHIPTVTRSSTPQLVNPLVPPLPVQVAGK